MGGDCRYLFLLRDYSVGTSLSGPHRQPTLRRTSRSTSKAHAGTHGSASASSRGGSMVAARARTSRTVDPYGMDTSCPVLFLNARYKFFDWDGTLIRPVKLGRPRPMSVSSSRLMRIITGALAVAPAVPGTGDGAVSVRQFAGGAGRSIGRRTDGREDEKPSVAEARVGGTVRICGVDSRKSSPARPIHRIN